MAFRGRRRARLAKPMRLSELLDRRSRRWRFRALAQLELIRAKWPEAAGAYVAAHVVPARLVRKQLRLTATDASWASEMTYLAPAVLERLRALLPGDWVKELKVVATEPELRPLLAPETRIELAEPDAGMQKEAERLVAELTDPTLAEAVRRATLARRRRLETKGGPAVDMAESPPEKT